MASEPKVLTIGDQRFRLARLKPKEALRGLRLISKVLLPAIGEAHSAPDGQLGDALSRVVEGLDCLPELLDLFATRTEVPSAANAEAWTPLPTFIDDTFTGRPDLMVQFIIAAVQNEYGTFLAANSPLRGLLKAAKPQAPTG